MGKEVLEGTNLYFKINMEKLDIKIKMLSNFQVSVDADLVDMTGKISEIT